MTTYAPFNTSTEWKELTNVSSVNGDFLVQNIGTYEVEIYLGDTPSGRGVKLYSASTIGKPDSVRVGNSSNIEKVWIRSEYPSIVMVNKD